MIVDGLIKALTLKLLKKYQNKIFFFDFKRVNKYQIKVYYI